MRKCNSLPRTCCFISLSIIFVACATLPPAPPVRADTPVAAPFNRTWDAVVDYFARSSIPIKTIDRTSGIIAAESSSLAGDNSGFAVCSNALAHVPALGANFNVLVRGDTAQSIVRVTATWIGSGASQMDVRCMTTDLWEKQFEAAIKAKAETR